AVLTRELAEALEEARGRADHAPLAEHGLYHHGGDVVRLGAQGALERVQVAVRQGDYVAQGPERALVLLVRGEGQRAQRLAVVSALEVHEALRLGPVRERH